jgi:hypothetical protein
MFWDCKETLSHTIGWGVKHFLHIFDAISGKGRDRVCTLLSSRAQMFETELGPCLHQNTFYNCECAWLSVLQFS